MIKLPLYVIFLNTILISLIKTILFVLNKFFLDKNLYNVKFYSKKISILFKKSLIFNDSKYKTRTIKKTQMESYEKLREIGKGSYGVVWLVKNRKDKKNVSFPSYHAFFFV